MSRDPKYTTVRLANALRSLTEVMSPHLQVALSSGNPRVVAATTQCSELLSEYAQFENRLDSPGVQISLIEASAKREKFGRDLAASMEDFGVAAASWIAAGIAEQDEAVGDCVQRANEALEAHKMREKSRSAMARKLEDILAISRGHMLNGNRLAIEIEATLAEAAETESAETNQAQSEEWITIQEAWQAAGGNPAVKASKAELIEALKQLDQV